MLSPYNATSMYVFRADHLAVDNQLMYSTLEKTTSPALQLYSVAYSSLCRVETHLVWDAHWCHFYSCLGSRFGDIFWLYLLILLEDTISQQTS